MIYLPLIEETGHMPTEKYTGLEWETESSRWIVRTNRGDEFRARFVAMGTGPLDKPKLPGIPGIENYTGHSFHTARWDFDYTGGAPDGAPMERLADKRVGIIGTGATSVQCIPHLAEACGELYVFQRTPSSIDARNNHPIDPDWFATLEPGWQDKWLVNFTILQTGGFTDQDLVKDGWTDISQRIRDRVLAVPDQDFSPESLVRAYHESDDERMAELRERVEELVSDPATAEALKPWYRQLCKRPCFHDPYLSAYNVPTVHLIDTDGQGVEQITGTGVVANGQDYELDCIIYASGFEVGTDYARRSGFDTVGRDGLKLSERWADGMRSLHGVHVHGFPNAFIVGPSQGANLISNIPSNLTDTAETIAAVVAHALETDATEVEVTPEAERAWIEKLESGGRTIGNDPSCTPGYYNNEGQPIDGSARLKSTAGDEGLRDERISVTNQGEAMSKETTIDPDELKMFSFKVWTYKMGEQVSLMVHLGDQLGLYGAMRGQGPMSSDELAVNTGLHERLLREWLYGQAAAGLIEGPDDESRFELSEIQAAVLADEQNSLAFAAGAFRGGIEPGVLDKIANSFRTGVGVTYEEQGASAAAGLARMTGPWSRLALNSVILPALDGVVAKLEAGASVVDIGCGGGVTLTTIAEAYPNSRCIGYDPSGAAVRLGRERAADMGLGNIEFIEAGGEFIESGADHDLVITFDCLHDMPHPDRAANAIRSAIASDGTWLIKDIRSSGDFAQDRRNPLLAMFYGFSVASCLQSAISEPEGMGLGTLGLHPARAQELAEAAGFTSFSTHDLGDAGNLYYEARP
ncbi:MAG: methyltransferase domain-containing protein [Actinomycetia bacterium]|nr:methyltransferase domain-containing protein [Actinomycetes bacterium]